MECSTELAAAAVAAIAEAETAAAAAVLGEVARSNLAFMSHIPFT